VDLEIIGLHCSSNGRCCSKHPICGASLANGDLLRLRKTVVTVNGKVEEAYKVVKIDDLTETCTVAFIPRVQSKLPKVKNNKLVVVKEVYDYSINTYKVEKSKKNHGMASVVFADDIPIQE
jgi:hypothetical protein